LRSRVIVQKNYPHPRRFGFQDSLKNRCHDGIQHVRSHTAVHADAMNPKLFLCSQDASISVSFLMHSRHLSLPELFEPEMLEIQYDLNDTIVDRIFPSSIVSSPPMVHPPGVATAFLIMAGCCPSRTIRAAPCIATQMSFPS
jgi:hypothetical protein